MRHHKANHWRNMHRSLYKKWPHHPNSQCPTHSGTVRTTILTPQAPPNTRVWCLLIIQGWIIPLLPRLQPTTRILIWQYSNLPVSQRILQRSHRLQKSGSACGASILVLAVPEFVGHCKWRWCDHLVYRLRCLFLQWAALWCLLKWHSN